MTGIATLKELTATKKYIQAAFRDLCGFAPAMKDIYVMEILAYDEGDPQYVRFDVNDHIFQYDGITMEII